MKALTAALFGLALATIPVAAPAATIKTKVVVTKVHGPLKILPHHKHKYCRTHWVHHHRVSKCWYH